MSKEETRLEKEEAGEPFKRVVKEDNTGAEDVGLGDKLFFEYKTELDKSEIQRMKEQNLFESKKESEAPFKPLPRFAEGDGVQEELLTLLDITTETVKIDAGPVPVEVELDLHAGSITDVKNTESVTSQVRACMEMESASSARITVNRMLMTL